MDAYNRVQAVERALGRVQSQKARTMIEHSNVEVPAGNAHRAAELVREIARDFIGRYRTWIERYL